MKLDNLSGQKFGKLTVICRGEDRIRASGKKEVRWLCQCDCGNKTQVVSHRLKNGETRSCGCLVGTIFKDLAGMRFGKLMVVKRVSNRKERIYYECLCDCGNTKIIQGGNLRSGVTKSCGCLLSEVIRAKLTTHGQSKKKIYKVWEAMKRRCTAEKSERYKNYGKRGITYVKDWESFSNFYKWAVLSGYKNSLTIDRVDVNGNYTPENCRWIPASEQGYNKTNSKLVTVGKETKDLAEWCKEKEISYHLVYQRLYRLGWPPEKALTVLAKKGRNQYEKRNGCPE